MVKQISDLKWKTVGVEGIPIGEDFSGFVGLEECTEYDLNSQGNKLKKKKDKLQQNQEGIQQNKRKQQHIKTEKLNKKIKLNNGFTVETVAAVAPSATNLTKNLSVKKEKLTNKKEKSLKNEQKEVDDKKLSMDEMVAWMQYQIPEAILKSLAEQGFDQPTKIQELTLPAAIMGRRDILGAAETGSGKTLAFGLPILCGILQLKEKELAGVDTFDIQYKKSSVKKVVKNVKEKKNKIVKKNSKVVSKKVSKIGNDADDGDDGDLIDKASNSDDSDHDSGNDTKIANDESENGSDDSNDFVHLSEMLDSDDLAESSDDENAVTGDDGVDVEEYYGMKNNDIGEGIGCVKVLDDIELPKPLKKTGKPLYALVLTPTRELAVQVAQHIRNAAKYTGIRVATIVGGMASVKQERILSKGPEIVVATPGRLWELAQAGYLQLEHVKFLAIDETDRMVERNHFDELKFILERMNNEASSVKSRQNFVFSATLTMVHDLPTHMKGKKVTKGGKILNRKVKKMTPELKTKKLIEMIGMTDPKVVDITLKNQGTAEKLTECMITCALEQKDVYLYYILHRFPGRAIIFCNSIGSVKRLAQLLSILKLEPLPLHASMIQKQRLKNLEKFTSKERSILVATDVAARGLDIANVDHVIHYQVPRTAENYIHRSGRTARANKEGLTILMIEPGEAYNYQKLCRTLERASDLPRFPIESAFLTPFANAVKIARELERTQTINRRANQEQGWYDKAAKEMDILVDEDFLSVKKPKSDATAKQIQAKKKELDLILSKPLFPKGFSYKFPTLNDHNALNPVQSEDNALKVMKDALACGKIKKDKRKSKNAPLLQMEQEFRKQNGGGLSKQDGGKVVRNGRIDKSKRFKRNKNKSKVVLTKQNDDASTIQNGGKVVKNGRVDKNKRFKRNKNTFV